MVCVPETQVSFRKFKDTDMLTRFLQRLLASSGSLRMLHQWRRLLDHVSGATGLRAMNGRQPVLVPVRISSRRERDRYPVNGRR